MVGLCGGVGVTVGEPVDVGVAVGVFVGVCVAVADGEPVAVGVGVPPAHKWPGEAEFLGAGTSAMKSVELLLLSDSLNRLGSQQ